MCTNMPLLAWMLSYLTQKEKPLTYIETHAGRAMYDLGDEEAFENRRSRRGYHAPQG